MVKTKKLSVLLLIIMGLIASAILLSFSQVSAENNGSPDLHLERVASGLNSAVDLAHAGDDRLFIVEQPGRIRILDNGSLLATPFLDIQTLVDDGGNEQGLLGLTFHPDYANNGYFYVNYTYDQPGGGNKDLTRVVRYEVSAGNPNVADASSAFIIIEIEQDFSNHNGGDINFSPIDDYLYIGMGDGGSGGDPCNRAQGLDGAAAPPGGNNCSTAESAWLLGKMLRIDVDNTTPAGANDLCGDTGNGAANYAIPVDNPYAGGSGNCDEIWSSGVRNPWRFNFDSVTGDMWIGDVGQNAREEIDFQPADSDGGENWGWRCYEGNQTFNTGGCGPIGNYDFPIFDYSHSTGGFSCSVTGGTVYRGADYPNLVGHYIFADYCSEIFWSATASRDSSSGWNITQFGTLPVMGPGTLSGVASITEGADGKLYVTEDSSEVFVIVDTSTPPTAISASDLAIISSANSLVVLSIVAILLLASIALTIRRRI